MPLPSTLPRIVAHRGASTTAAEHTIAAYRRAIDEGADALECDVRLTADGHLVCVHDSRIDRTSDGRGRVSNKTLSQLRERDFSSWWEGDAEPPAIDHHEPGVLTLEELLELVLESDHRVDLAIETKHPTRYGGYTEQVLLQTLERYGLANPQDDLPHVRVMSFSAIAMRRMRELAPQIPTVYLMERAPVLLVGGTLPFGASIAGPSIEILRKDSVFVDRWRASGNEVHVWVVDHAEDVRLCLEHGVSALITNRPAQVRAWRDEAWRQGGAELS